ncbi:MAG: FHA domain-containing protein [Kofleriaceae bacterium]|nr:FHA domain-containing protein [Kofleriaceae bacterium]
MRIPQSFVSSLFRVMALALAATLLCGVVISGVALAQKQVQLQVKPADPKDPKRKGMAPEVEATIIGAGAGVPLDKFSLLQTDAKTPIPPIKASSVRAYIQGSETIAVAVLIEGQQIWIGNDTYIPEGGEGRYEGALTKLAPVIDKLNKVGPPGSLGTVLVYHSSVDTKLPMGELKNLNGAALGNQRDYQNKVSSELTNGVIQALAELKKVTTSRKALVVIGDGGDTNADAAKKALAELKKQAEADRVEVFAIVFQSALEVEVKVIGNLVPGATTANTAESVAAAIDGIVARLNDRVYVTFPGYDLKLKTGFTWDGKEHEMMVKIDQDELETKSLVLAPPWKRAGAGFPWALAIGLSLGSLLLIWLGVAVFKKKPAPEAAPIMVEAPMAAPAAPKGPMKTVMIGAGGDQDGFPIVGWLVALNGPNAFRTYRLRSGTTKIGTGGPVDIIVNDGFLSTEHCQIGCSPSGFVLQDLKSTNGCMVNERRVERHDLVDNDLITLGKTNFKFKSIN